MKIEDEIKQEKAFKNEYLKAHINMLFTSSWINNQVSHIFKPYDITWQQFNILRILRGRYPEPCSVKELMDRMIDRTSNASRLVDKLITKNLADRNTCPDDRRQVEVKINDMGLEVVAKVSEVLEEWVTTLFSSISEKDAWELNRILDKLRG